MMKFKYSKLFVGLTVLAVLTTLVQAQTESKRKELKRTDLTGAHGMEVISSISEYKPGDVIGKHWHYGVEAGYIVQGAMIQPSGKEPIELPTGTPLMNLRKIPHAGFKVVGDTSLKIFTVHIVDKGKPLYIWDK